MTTDLTLMYHPDGSVTFEYRGFTCDIEYSCCSKVDRRTNQRRTSDRSICWLTGHRDYDGNTHEEYLKKEGEPDCWCPAVYLIDWFMYGTVDDFAEHWAKTLTESIDKFIDTKGIDNI